jgi:hypothetical protein
MRIPCLGLYALILFWGGVGAVEAANNIEVRFIVENVTRDLKQVRLAHEEWRSGVLGLTAHSLSLPQDVPARAFRVLASEQDVELATVNLPEEGTSFVVLLVMNSDQTYASVVIRSDDPRFTAGGFYLYNNSDKTVTGSVGVTEFTLRPRRETMLKPDGARNNSYYDVKLVVREKGASRMIGASRWPKDEKVRSYVIFYLDPKAGRVAYRAVDEFMK